MRLPIQSVSYFTVPAPAPRCIVRTGGTTQKARSEKGPEAVTLESRRPTPGREREPASECEIITSDEKAPYQKREFRITRAGATVSRGARPGAYRRGRRAGFRLPRDHAVHRARVGPRVGRAPLSGSPDRLRDSARSVRPRGSAGPALSSTPPAWRRAVRTRRTVYTLPARDARPGERS